MEIDFRKGKTMKALIRRLCYMAFGISAMTNPLDALNLYNIIIGAIIGLLFGWIFRVFIKGFLGMFNGSFKKEKGKDAIRYATDNGMLFLTPFALMLLLATFLLNWSMTVPFISAGLMAVGTASSIEMGRLLGKQRIKNTIATTVVSFIFSFIWTLSFPYLYKAPSLVEGGVTLVRLLLGGGGL
ncbi:MAG: hypothetical protein GX129_08835 [Clostridiales bacterium]|nr:hypothetical protein [Clostridiales bacterium]